MTTIQLLLVAALVCGALVASSGAKLVYRFAMFALILLGMFFAVLPQRANEIRALLGVDRRTDLLLYLSVAAGGYALLLIYLRTRRLEQKLTQHVRAAALQNAIPPDQHS